MPLPGSGPLSFSAIQTEFGGSNPISLSEYYGVAAGVPASGPIDVSDFYGKSAESFAATPLNLDATDFGTINSEAIVTFSANGTWSTVEVNGASNGGNWRTPTDAGAGANFQIKFELISNTGGVTTPTLGTWLNLTAGRTVRAEVLGSGSESGSFSYDIRRTVGGAIVVSGTVSVSATV